MLKDKRYFLWAWIMHYYTEQDDLMTSFFWENLQIKTNTSDAP